MNLEPGSLGQTVAYDIDVDMDDVDFKARIRDVLTRLAPPVDNKVTRLDQEVCLDVQSRISACRMTHQCIVDRRGDPGNSERETATAIL